MTDLDQIDFSPLDRPEVLGRLFYPRREGHRPAGATGEDLWIPVGEEVGLAGRLHRSADRAPILLFFHGNGEIVADYDELGPLFARAGLHFLAVDYRGYGRSSGTPTVTDMMRDCHLVFDFARGWLGDRGLAGPVLVAGRSLGSASALELASARGHPAVAGLVVESGFASTLPLLRTLGIDADRLSLREEHCFRNLEKIASYEGPTLLIHGERDHLIPVVNAHELFEASGAADKKLLLLPQADHNSVFLHGLEQYLEAVTELAGKVGAVGSVSEA